MKTQVGGVLFLACAVYSSAALANVVWPALYLEGRLATWWAVSIGLLIEFLFVGWLFALPPKRTAVAVLAANVASAIAGAILIPLAGFVWEIFPGQIYMKLLGWGTFNPITWAGAVLMACFINAGIEVPVYIRGFKLAIRKREFWWLVLANAITVGVAFTSILLVPVEL
jgi:hypothetical protein